jgi:integrase
MGLGSVDLHTLAEARGLALDARKAVAKGIDPIEQRSALERAAREEQRATFAYCFEAYLTAHRTRWRSPGTPVYLQRAAERHLYPVFGELSVREIDDARILQALTPIWSAHPPLARNMRSMTERVLDWAKVKRLRQGDNPARWRGHLDVLLAPNTQKPEHWTALPYAQIPDFLAALQQRAERLPAIRAKVAALRFQILTALRPGAAYGARWSEIDMAGRVWTIPGSRMKAGVEHRVPLSAPALDLLDDMAKLRKSEFVFPALRAAASPVTRPAMTAVLRQSGYSKITTLHGFRSCFSDWTSEETNFSKEVREMALAHAIPNVSEAAYRRGDLFEKRRQLMEAWGDHCLGITSAENVIPLRLAAR